MRLMEKGVLAAMLVFATMVEAKSPKLNLHLAHNSPLEMRKEMQIERLADKYDLTKYTLTTEIEIEQGGMAHSKPVLTLNGRFMDDDDLALSQYVHEQGHWVLGRHPEKMRALFGFEEDVSGAADQLSAGRVRRTRHISAYAGPDA